PPPPLPTLFPYTTLFRSIAFRATFDGPPPPPSQRYWRGPILSKFDGRTWTAGPFIEAETPFYTPTGRRLDYVLTLEPHNRRWLLDRKSTRLNSSHVKISY